jgi:hypothetical protein
MPKSKKPKPSFDVPPAAAPAETGWVYRSGEAIEALVPAPETALVPAAPLRTLAAPGRSRGAMDWLSFPFEVAVMLGVAALRVVARR